MLLCVATFSLHALADTIVLTNGEKVEGKVTAETDAEVTVSARVSAGITDDRVIKKSDIVSMTKDSPDLAAWEPLKNLRPGKSSLPLASYDAVLNPLKGFLNEYPQSKFAPDAQKALDAFAADKKRVDAGEAKLDDKWLSKEETEKERVQINGQMAFNYMKEQSARDMTAALNTFDAIEKNYSGARSFPDAVEYAQKLLPALKAEVDRRLKTANDKKLEREKQLAALSGKEKTALQDEITRERTAADAATSAAEKQNLKWLPLGVSTERSLQNTSSKIPSEMQRLNSMQVGKLRAAQALAEKAKGLVTQKDFAGAETALTQALNDWPKNELATRLQNEVRAAKATVVATPPPAPTEPAPPAPTETEPVVKAEVPSDKAASEVEVEKEPPFLLTAGGAVTMVVLVAFLVAAFSAFKKIKGRANDVLE